MRACSATESWKALLRDEEVQIKTWDREENQWGDGSAWNKPMIECELTESARHKKAASRALALLAELAFVLPIARALDQERSALPDEESDPDLVREVPVSYSDALAALYTRLHRDIYGHGESFPQK